MSRRLILMMPLTGDSSSEPYRDAGDLYTKCPKLLEGICNWEIIHLSN